MDVVDGQIVDTLLRLDPSFFDSLPEAPSTVTELEAETFYQAIVLLLWACKPCLKEKIPSKLLPENMSAKFRCATSVVDAVKNLGVRDRIDYHTLLYGRSKELRNILIGLIEKLPRDSPVVAFTEDPLSILIRSAVFTKSLRDKFWRNSSRKTPRSLPERVDFMGFSGDVVAALRCDESTCCQAAFICSLLESNAISVGRPQDCHSVRAGILDAIQIEQPNIRIKPRLKPKPKPKPVPPPKPQKKPAKVELENEEVSRKNEETSESLTKLMNEVMSLTAAIGRKKASEARMRKSEAERLSELESKRFLETKIDERLKKLLENPDAVTKLESYIDESSERMQHLQNRWLGLKAEKDEEVNVIRQATSSSGDNLLYRDREAVLKDTKAAEDELAGKKKVLEKLKDQVESREERQINRSIYTKHIFDIVGNIRKQQDEINKIAVENLQLQKEIKSMAGKLERSFTVVEGKLYNDVEKDGAMQKAYRLLLKIHNECSWVITSIDSSGQLEREIEELSDQIAAQQQKKADEKLENIVNDWLKVKKENASLNELLNDCDN